MQERLIKEFLAHATEMAKESGEILKKYWGKLENIQSKGVSWNLVTEADQESEELILNAIRKTYPTHTVLSEESGLHHQDSDFTWIIDPLDGTTNYTHQYPMVAISIALFHQSTPLVGVVYNPILNELFQAAFGLKCLLNGAVVTVSSVNSLELSLLATGFAYNRREAEENNYREFCYLTSLSQGVRRSGSAALDLANVACGRLDGFWEMGLSPWDMAAGVVLINEAKGRVSSFAGDMLQMESGRILASNGAIHQQLVDSLSQV